MKGRRNIGWGLLLSLMITFLMTNAAVVKGDWESEANARIEGYRKRDAQITVVNQGGSPIEGVEIDVNQIKHHFAFGACIRYPSLYNSDYRDFVLDHFEWAVCENETKWSSNEATRDSENYSQADYMYNWCNDNGIAMRGHTLVWETGAQTPSWVSGLDCEEYPTPSEMLDEIDERIDSAVDHFKDKFVNWDVDNEMLSGDFFDCFGEAGRVHMFERANVVDPNCGLFMNEYAGNSFGGYNSGPYVSRASSLISMGAPIHGLGIQGHVSPTFDPERYWDDVLQPLGTLGLPIWVTEFDYSEGNDSLCADGMEDFYRICFSDPNVAGIMMWGFWEKHHWRENWWLANEDWSLNAQGVRYESLMDEWTTTDSNTTDGSGEVGFRGFHGTYEITMTIPGVVTETETIELEPGETAAEFTLELGGEPDDCDEVYLLGYGLASDISGDCHVNYEDLKIIADSWLYTDCAFYEDCNGADFEPDGDVDFFDFSMFAPQWMQCNDPEDGNCTSNWQ